MTDNPWVRHFSDMAEGLIPYREKHYTMQPQVGSGDVQIVTPTQAVVDRAKMDAKRKLQEAATYKPKRIRSASQSGAGSKKKRNKKKSKRVCVKKSTKKKSKSKGKKKSKK